MTALLEVRDLMLHYSTLRGQIRAVDGVSFTLEGGEALGLVGESGSGKSSIALAILRSLPKNVVNYRGAVYLEGVNLTELSNEEFRRKVRWRKISMVFQGAMNSLNPVLKVGHQIIEPLSLDKSHSKQEAQQKAESLLEMVGLPREVFHRYPHELSGGMKQRAIIAMALILDPLLVILDEPTSALDVSVQAQITNLLKRLKAELNLSIVFITHDIALTSDICDYIAIVYGGRIVEHGSIEQILSTPAHPYTQKLLASIPRLQVGTKPEFIPGSPPDMVSPPPGCRFHPRCPFAFEPCDNQAPPLFEVGVGHGAECWLYRDRSRAGDILASGSPS